MKVTQEKLPASQVGLEIEVTPEMSKKAYEQVIQDFTRSINIPGFRKGKVPRPVLIQRIGTARLKASALENLIDSSLKEAIQQEKIKALGNFQLRSVFDDLVEQFEPGAPLTFSASVDVQPEVTIKQYRDLKVKAEEVKADPERVDKVLDQYRERLATLVPVEDRPAQMKDVVVVDYQGVLVGEDPDAEPEPIPGGEASNFQVELEEGRFIPGFIDGIVGMTPSESKEIVVQFPEDYPQETLAGRKARFSLTLKEIKEKELPPLDDDFAEEVSEYQTLAELRESLAKRYAQEAEDKTRSNQERAILDELLNQIEVEIPETLIEQEVNYMLNQTAMQLQNQGIDIRRIFTQESIPAIKQQSRPEAIKRIRRTLALGEIAKLEALEVAEEEVTKRANELLQELRDVSMDRDRLREVVTDELMRTKIIDWLIENSTIELVPEGTLQAAEAETVELPATGSEGQPDSSEPIESATAVGEESPTAEADPVVAEAPTEEAQTGKSAAKGKRSKKTATDTEATSDS